LHSKQKITTAKNKVLNVNDNEMMTMMRKLFRRANACPLDVINDELMMHDDPPPLLIVNTLPSGPYV